MTNKRPMKSEGDMGIDLGIMGSENATLQVGTIIADAIRKRFAVPYFKIRVIKN